jgi:methyl-accepting chemotaxis protein
MFITPAERDSAAYREYWMSLNRGDYQAGEYKRRPQPWRSRTP